MNKGVIRNWLLGLALLASASLPAAASAQASVDQSRPLPSFTVFAPDGRPVPSLSLGGQAPWVLIYVRPDGAATRRVLAAFASWGLPPEARRRVVLVVEGPVEDAAALAGELPGGAEGVSWFADPAGDAARGLALTGAPAVRGVRSGAVHWALDGALGEPSAYAPAVLTWIGVAAR